MRTLSRFQSVGFSACFIKAHSPLADFHRVKARLYYLGLNVTRKGFFGFSPVKLACVKRVILFH